MRIVIRNIMEIKKAGSFGGREKDVHKILM
jgi:hypothetical protein